MALSLNNSQWEYKVASSEGTLYYCNESGFINQIFVNGVQVASLQYPNSNTYLTYTYNFMTNNFHNEMLQCEVNINIFDNLIVKLFDNLPDKDKELIYHSILNQDSSYEWSIESLKVMIITFFSGINPQKYLIANEEDNSWTIKTLAEQLDKVIIFLPAKTYLTLKNQEGINTLKSWWGGFCFDYLKKVMSSNDLSSETQKSNFDFASKFINNLINTNNKIKQLLQSVNLRIIANLPLPVIYLPNEKVIYLSQNSLDDKLNLAKNIFIALYLEKLHELYNTTQYGLLWTDAYNLKPIVERFDDSINEDDESLPLSKNSNDQQLDNANDNNNGQDVSDEDNSNTQITNEQITNQILQVFTKKATKYQLPPQQAGALLQKSIAIVCEANNPNCTFNVTVDLNNNEITINKVLTVISDEDYEQTNNQTNLINIAAVIADIPDVNVGDTVNLNVPLNTIITPTMFRQIIDLFIKQIVNLNKIVGTVVDGKVESINLDQAITYVTFNNGKGILYENNEINGEELLVGNTYKFLVEDKNNMNSEYEYRLSRNSSELVKQLFYDCVPALQVGIIDIVKIARWAGNDTKILVKTNNSNINPVSACYGKDKSILHQIVNEIFLPSEEYKPHHEMINIIADNNDPITLIANACKPIKIIGVEIISVDNKKANVIAYQKDVPSLIGKKGANIKLIYELTRWSLTIMNQDEAVQKAIAYVPLNARPYPNVNDSTLNNNQCQDEQVQTDEITDDEVNETDIDSFNNEEVNAEESVNNNDNNQYEVNDNISTTSNAITDFSQLPEFAQLAKEIDGVNSDNDVENNNSNDNTTDDNDDSSQINNRLIYQDNLNKSASVNEENENQKELNQSTIKPNDKYNEDESKDNSTNEQSMHESKLTPQQKIMDNSLNDYFEDDANDDEDVIHLGQPFLSATQLTQVYRTLDGQVNEEVPFYLKWLVDSWPWNFMDDEFSKVDVGTVPLKLEFWEENLIFSLEVKNWTNMNNSKITSCQILHENLADALQWQNKLKQLNNEVVNVNHWNDFMYVMIVSLKVIEKWMENSAEWKTRTRNHFMPYCYVRIGNYVTVKVNYPGVPEYYKLGNGDRHPIKCWDDLLLSMLNLASLPIKQIPFNNKLVHHFFRPCTNQELMQKDWALIGSNSTYCYLKLEPNWMKTLIRAIIFMNRINKCDYKE